MVGRKISKKSKKIVKLIKNGERPFAIVKRGYSRDTVRYYWRKINYPDRHFIAISKIKALNKARMIKKLSTV